MVATDRRMLGESVVVVTMPQKRAGGDLHLRIRGGRVEAKRKATLDELLVHNFAVPEHRGDHKCTVHGCRNTGPNTEGLVHQTFWESAPPVLCLQLGRGVKEFENGVEVARWKITNHVEFDVRVVWAGFDYHLVGVVEHEGRFLDVGHYVSAVRDGYDAGAVWRRYDDGRVTQLEERAVLRMQAYILVYVRGAEMAGGVV